jgi:hypothetical protein
MTGTFAAAAYAAAASLTSIGYFQLEQYRVKV